MIGHTDVFWIGVIITGHTMNITQTNTNTSHRVFPDIYEKYKLVAITNTR